MFTHTRRMATVEDIDTPLDDWLYGEIDEDLTSEDLVIVMGRMHDDMVQMLEDADRYQARSNALTRDANLLHGLIRGMAKRYRAVLEGER